MIVVALILVVGKITFMSLIPVLKQQRVSNAYNTTLSTMRLARDTAVAQRTSMKVTFTKTSTSASITMEPTVSFPGAPPSQTFYLPSDVTFSVETGVASTPTPDGFGTAANAIDFGYTASGTGSGGANVIYFCPDGSSQDATGGAGNCAGNWNGGVVYIARPGEVLSSRAISLWGGTGRVRGWRLYSAGGSSYLWKRQ